MSFKNVILSLPLLISALLPENGLAQVRGPRYNPPGGNPRASCSERLESIRPEWRIMDRNYICTARNTLRIDTNFSYNDCVAQSAQATGNGEVIIDSCLNGQVVRYFSSCVEESSRLRPEWSHRDLNYVCSARSTLRVDYDQNYSRCVIQSAQTSGNGEFIINSCLRGEPTPYRGSCAERLQRTRPEWMSRDINYICTARNSMNADANPQYTDCVDRAAYVSGNGEYIINQCLSNPQAPYTASCEERMSNLRPDWRRSDVLYVCTARNTLAIGRDSRYTNCIYSAAQHTNSGEFIINQCL